MLSYGHGDQNVSNNMTKRCSLARAKYDNLAESHDELAFRKGDVLTVIDQRIDGLDGWWLCSFRGRQGIVPANRLTLLAGMYYESALRFSASPESSISDGGGGVDYDIPRNDPQNRSLPPVPTDSTPASAFSNRGAEASTPTRDLVYDIPKSLEKTRVHARQSNHSVNNQPSGIGDLGKALPDECNIYDTPPSAQLNIASAGLMGHRASAGTLSPPYKSGDSAVDLKSNRSSLMSNASSPPNSTLCDSSSEISDVYDTPSNSHKFNYSRRQLQSSAKNNHRQSDDGEGYYDVPKTIQETLLEYYSRDSGIYDNARLSTIQTSPQKDMDVYDSPVPSSKISARTPQSLPTKDIHSSPRTFSPGLANSLNEPETLYDSPAQVKSVIDQQTLYDIPPQVTRDSPRLATNGNAGHKLTEKMGSLDLQDMDKLSLDLEEAIEIIVKLQQHVHTSSTRLLSFVRVGWRERANLESVLYDLKIACVGLQSTLQEFYDFGVGALANSSAIADRTVMNRLAQTLSPLKLKLGSVNNSMKSLSGIKWHIAKLAEPLSGSALGSDDDLMRLMTVARESSEDVNRVASVIHGNSRLLFKSSPSSVQGLLCEAKQVSDMQRQASCLVREESIDTYHEYDYCEVIDREDTPTNPPQSQPELQSKEPAYTTPAADLEQDSQYLRYYLQHVHTTCDTVKQHVLRLEEVVDSGDQSNHSLVAQSKLVVSTAHKLVYIGDTLCRSIKQSNIHSAVSSDANTLCNVLKDFIMTTKETALATPAARAAALSRLRPNIRAVQLQSESFRDVIESYAHLGTRR